MDREIIMDEVINFLSFLYILLVMFFFFLSCKSPEGVVGMP